MKKFTVWVGGVEVNDHYLPEVDAYNLAQVYIDDQYEDVKVEEIK